MTSFVPIVPLTDSRYCGLVVPMPTLALSPRITNCAVAVLRLIPPQPASCTAFTPQLANCPRSRLLIPRPYQVDPFTVLVVSPPRTQNPLLEYVLPRISRVT